MTQNEKKIECCGAYPTLAVRDVGRTCNWYVSKLGFDLRFLWGEPATHGAVTLDQACLHFWEGTPQLNENWIYFDVTDLDAIYGKARSSGVQITKEPRVYPWGMREFNLIDLDGYRLRFGQYHEEKPSKTDA